MDDVIWELAPHTAAKHRILRKYLGAWFPKLATWQGRVIFVDGFAGPGEYKGGEPGSPIIALDSAINHKHDLSACELGFLFVEQDRRRFAHLERLIKSLDPPNHIKIQAIHSTFADVMGEVFTRLDGAQMAPAFVMIDPFGVKGLPYDVIARLAGYRRSELLISFMFESMNRFLASAEFEPHLDALFGCERWREALTMEGSQRKSFLLALYVDQLRLAGLEYVRSFEMRDEKNRTEYYLIFATHHEKGLEAMKRAMWSTDPLGTFQFSDRTDPNQPTLFSATPDYNQLQGLILQRFSGETTSIEEIEQFVITTPFLITHLRKNVLVPLEEAGVITVETERKRARTYPAGTVIRFRG